MNISTMSLISWQGYRHKETGVIVYYDSSETNTLPIRTNIGKKGKIADADPNYETLTYGLQSCTASAHRTNFVKNKCGYLFFMTKYQGAEKKHKDKIMITGYYKIASIAEVQKIHIRNLGMEDSSCFNSKLCYALKAEEAVFLAEEDCYVLTKASLSALGIDKKITKATKIELDEEKTKKLLKKFEGKENKIADYIAQSAV